MKMNTLSMFLFVFGVSQVSLAAFYDCDDSEKTVIDYNSNQLIIGSQVYKLNVQGMSGVDANGIYVMTYLNDNNDLEIGFNDGGDLGDQVDQWTCTLVK
jgi:hypothetical protein